MPETRGIWTGKQRVCERCYGVPCSPRERLSVVEIGWCILCVQAEGEENEV